MKGDAPRLAQINVRVSEEELEEVRRAASDEGFDNVAQMVRMCVRRLVSRGLAGIVGVEKRRLDENMRKVRELNDEW